MQIGQFNILPAEALKLLQKIQKKKKASNAIFSRQSIHSKFACVNRNFVYYRLCIKE